jgi:CheY-like chemotaxis protein/tetratricopeptide (TPR) repeat protein
LTWLPGRDSVYEATFEKEAFERKHQRFSPKRGVSVSKSNLLLIDGDPRSLRVLEVSLRKEGYMVTPVASAEDALEKIDTANPDVIISDTQLSKMDGFSLCEKLKQDPKWASVPYIFLTGQKAVQDKIRGLELGVEEYLTKPIFIKEIIIRIKMLLQRRQRDALARKEVRTTFSGNLSDMAVVDLVQTLELGRKSGILHFTNDFARQGAIYFRNGQIIDAELGRLQGEAALYRLLGWSEGSFEVEFKVIRRNNAISRSNQALLIEGMRRVDEWGRLLEQLPPLDTLFEVDFRELRERLVEIPDEVNGILRVMDGRRTLLQVIDDSDFGDLEALEIISKLYFEGLIFDTAKGPGRRSSSDSGSFAVPLLERTPTLRGLPAVQADATEETPEENPEEKPEQERSFAAELEQERPSFASSGEPVEPVLAPSETDAGSLSKVDQTWTETLQQVASERVQVTSSDSAPAPSVTSPETLPETRSDTSPETPPEMPQMAEREGSLADPGQVSDETSDETNVGDMPASFTSRKVTARWDPIALPPREESREEEERLSSQMEAAEEPGPTEISHVQRSSAGENEAISDPELEAKKKEEAEEAKKEEAKKKEEAELEAWLAQEEEREEEKKKNEEEREREKEKKKERPGVASGIILPFPDVIASSDQEKVEPASKEMTGEDRREHRPAADKINQEAMASAKRQGKSDPNEASINVHDEQFFSSDYEEDAFTDSGITEDTHPSSKGAWVAMGVVVVVLIGAGVSFYYYKTSPYVGDGPPELQIDRAKLAQRKGVNPTAPSTTATLGPARDQGQPRVAPSLATKDSGAAAPSLVAAKTPDARSPAAVITLSPGAGPDQGVGATSPTTAPSVAPSTEEAYQALLTEAQDLKKRGKRGQAYKKFIKAAEVNPKGWEALQEMALHLMDGGQMAKALEVARRAEAVQAEAPYAQLVIGAVLQEQGKKAEAKKAYEAFLRLCPTCRFAKDIRAVLKTM